MQLSLLRSLLTRFKAWSRKRGLQVSVIGSVTLALMLPALVELLAELNLAEQRARSELQIDLDRESEVLAASMSTPLWEFSVSSGEAIARSMVRDQRFVSIVVTDSATQRIFVELHRIAGAAPRTISIRKVIQRDGKEIGTVDAAMTLDPYMATTRELQNRHLLQTTLVLLAALAFIILLLRRSLLKPIRLLTNEAHRIASQQLASPVLFVGNNELGQVADAMEKMRQHLLTAFDQLQENNRRSTAIIEASPVPLAVISSAGEISLVNVAFTETFGYAKADIPQITRLWELCYPDTRERELFIQQWRHHLDDAQRTGERFMPLELSVRCKDGSNRTVVCSATALEKDFSGDHLLALFDITERKIAEDQIKNLAFFDQLTGLANRTLLMDRLRQGMATSDRSGVYGALLFIDLDNFKVLNDTLGHDVGDLLLKEIAQRLQACVREGDTVARLGGDEFVVMLTGLETDPQTSAALTENIGEKILAALRKDCRLGVVNHPSSGSVGATLFCGQRIGIDELLKQADLAMYKAKDAGRNTLRFFDPAMEAAVMEHSALENSLRKALAEGQLSIHVQPQVLDDGRVVGAEVLARWWHPERGLVSPAMFIPVAEETGLIVPLGQWVLEAACQQLARWSTQPAFSHLTLAVNVSARQFRQSVFTQQVIDTIVRTGANPHRLKLELTESLMVANIDEIIGKMFALKAQGVGFSLDDFGTGYSSLSYLKRMPLDQLKIDQSFVRDVLIDPNDAAIANTIVALGRSLGLGVIAEGVETEAQQAFLAQCGCHAFQGYYFSRPTPIDEFERFIQSRDSETAPT